MWHYEGDDLEVDILTGGNLEVDILTQRRRKELG
jgi:hypothetical protein